MFWDILIAAGIGAVQLVITWYAVHISVKENRVRNAFIIGVVGFIGIALTIYGAIRSGTTQIKLESDIAELKNGQKTTNAGIQHIEQTPPPSPVINVNPPPAPAPTLRADIALDKIESAWDGPTMVDGRLTLAGALFAVDRRAFFNIYFINNGSARADDMNTVGLVYITSTATEKELTAKFRKYFSAI